LLLLLCLSHSYSWCSDHLACYCTRFFFRHLSCSWCLSCSKWLLCSLRCLSCSLYLYSEFAVPLWRLVFQAHLSCSRLLTFPGTSLGSYCLSCSWWHSCSYRLSFSYSCLPCGSFFVLPMAPPFSGDSLFPGQYIYHSSASLIPSDFPVPSISLVPETSLVPNTFGTLFPQLHECIKRCWLWRHTACYWSLILLCRWRWPPVYVLYGSFPVKSSNDSWLINIRC
jgi:hypothetical protein